MTDNIHLNFDLLPYRKSSAWQRLSTDHPNLIANKILEYPRYISGDSLNKLSGSSATLSHKRKHTGESVPSPLLRIINNCEDCDSPCDPILFNLSSDKHSHQYYNDTDILSSIVDPHPLRERLKCLIDTGALHGSYVETWIRALNLKESMGDNNRLICCPISNSCTPITPVSYTHLTLPTIYSV